MNGDNGERPVPDKFDLYADLPALRELFDHMAGRVKYVWGAKAKYLSSDSALIKGLDCSGFAQYAAFRMTHGKITLPEGSQEQLAWAIMNLRKLDRYSDVSYAENDPNRLFICFIRPHGGHPGHVWFVSAGKTMESHGGAGVDSRAWDEPVLRNNAYAAFEWPVTAPAVKG